MGLFTDIFDLFQREWQNIFRNWFRLPFNDKNKIKYEFVVSLFELRPKRDYSKCEKIVITKIKGIKGRISEKFSFRCACLRAGFHQVSKVIRLNGRHHFSTRLDSAFLYMFYAASLNHNLIMIHGIKYAALGAPSTPEWKPARE